MKTMLTIGLFIAIFAIISGMLKKAKATEIQKYETLYSDDNFEIRYYPEAILATVSMEGNYDNSRNSGFRTLAGYIFGGNDENMKIAMTAPVRMGNDNENNTMSFVLPRKMEFDQLPEPNSKEIMLHQSKPVFAATIRYGGYTNVKEIEKRKSELIEKLNELGITHENNFEYLGYNAPYDMFNRRNEVWVELKDFDPDELQKIIAEQ